MKLIKAQWLCVDIGTEFHPNLSRNAEGSVNLLSALSKVWLSLGQLVRESELLRNFLQTNLLYQI